MSKSKKKYTLECKVCGNSFDSMSKTAKYCSDECRNNAYECVCKICGKVFRSNISKANICNECKKKGSMKLVCSVCNKEFQSFSNTKYCSFECRELEEERKKERYREKRIKRQQSNKSIVNKSNYKSIVEFTVKEIINKGIEARDNYGIEKNYYPIGFTSSIKTEVQERDKYTCRICGKKNSLEVHHIIKVKYGGDSNIDNLITLCVSCHRAVDTLDLDYAITKCMKNAKKNLGIEYYRDSFTLKEKVEISILELNALYSKLSKLSDEIEIQESMMRLNDIIENLQESIY